MGLALTLLTWFWVWGPALAVVGHLVSARRDA
jgi:hypothetical protein